MKQEYWVALGQNVGSAGTYPQSLIDRPHWRDSAMRDDVIVGLVRLEIDLRTGEVLAALEKNTKGPIAQGEGPTDRVKELEAIRENLHAVIRQAKASVRRLMDEANARERKISNLESRNAELAARLAELEAGLEDVTPEGTG